MNGIAAFINDFWRRPFSPEGDAIDWFLFLGFVLVLVVAWKRILKQIIPSE